MTAEKVDRPILITGGCGFIGINLADALAGRGEQVIAFDNLSRSGVRENAQWLKSRHGDLVTIITGDVRDATRVALCDSSRSASALALARKVLWCRNPARSTRFAPNGQPIESISWVAQLLLVLGRPFSAFAWKELPGFAGFGDNLFAAIL